jgi:protein phosphatase 2C family protein 2/3
MKKKLKEIQKDNSINKKIHKVNDINKYNLIKNTNQNYRKIKLISKNDLPELKLSKLKSRHESDSFNFKNINNSNASNNNITNASDIQNKKIMILNISKNNPVVNRNDLIFPKIINPIKNHFYRQDKNSNDSSNSIENQNSNSKNRSINNNKRNNGHIILSKMQNKRKKEIIKKNLSEIHRIQKHKNFSFSPDNKKPNKQNNKIDINNNSKFRLHFLLQPIPKNSIQIPALNISSSTNNIHSDKNNNNSKNSFNHEINLKLNNSINIKSLYTKKLKQSSSAKSVNFIPNEFKSLDNITDRNNKNINILMNKLTPITSPSLINKSQNSALNNIFSPLAKSISLPSDIIHKSFLGFEESITSYYSEFSPPIKSIIKGYAYNSNKGNVRNYNEDTICVKKINSKIEQIFYFFGIFDGHGGKGCASFLQENLYKYIQNFSSESLEKAIYQSENDFLSNYAVDINNNLKDTSGSCGVMAMIKNNKLIIANIGDSRIVLFKNGKLFFETEDHKPNSEKEKERIKNSGGQIYQSQSLIPIYQKINLPWRVLPGRLSVSRTFGDIQAKTEKFGGKSGVIIPVPDMTEFDLDESFDFMVIGCDGIFDVISNEQIFDIWKIVLNEQRYKDLENDELDINVLCGDFADAIIKSSLFKNSYDNLSCIVVVFNLNKYNFDLN